MNRSSLIEINIENGIATVTLNRPDKRNAVSMSMFIEIRKTIRTLKKKRQLRCVVVNGRGEDFCSGLDVKSLMGSWTSYLRLLFKWLPGNRNLAQYVCLGWQDIPCPVIFAIHGHCWGAGLQIALGGDIRIASHESDFSIMEGKLGLIPDMGGNVVLRSLMPIDRALKIAMTAEIFNAEDACRLGIVTLVSQDPLAEAQRLANQLIEQSPDALAAVKRLYTRKWTSSPRNILASETGYQLKVLSGTNQRIKVARVFKNKPTEFKDRMNW